MDDDNKTAVRPKLERTARASNVSASKDRIARRTAARRAYRVEAGSRENQAVLV
jgi:hypothetical protein